MKLVGKEKSEIVGQHQRSLHLPEANGGPFECSFEHHLKEQEGCVLESQVVTKNGEIKDVAIKANLIELRGKRLLQGIFRDITEIKAEKNLKNLEAFDERIIDSLGDALLLIDPDDYTIIRVNEAASKQLNLTKKDLIGKTCHQTTHQSASPCQSPEHVCSNP